MELKRDPLVFQSQMKSGDDDETTGSERELNPSVADTETPAAVLASKEIAEAVNAAMDALPVELRNAIALRENDKPNYRMLSILNLSTLICGDLRHLRAILCHTENCCQDSYAVDARG
jgi:hypothetical protein